MIFFQNKIKVTHPFLGEFVRLPGPVNSRESFQQVNSLQWGVEGGRAGPRPREGKPLMPKTTRTKSREMGLLLNMSS